MINHYGKWVDHSEPITGVISINDVSQFISDEIQVNGIDLAYEEAPHEFEQEFMKAHNGKAPI